MVGADRLISRKMANTQAGSPRVDWFAAGLGLVAAVLVQLLGGAFWFAHGPIGQDLLAFGAVFAGGLLAGWIGPASGGQWNGMLVAIGFIAVAALAQTIFETQLAQRAGPAGSGSLDTIGLVVVDLIELSGGTLGGWLGRRARTLVTGSSPASRKI